MSRLADVKIGWRMNLTELGYWEYAAKFHHPSNPINHGSDNG
jgi:hypothetical protein